MKSNSFIKMRLPENMGKHHKLKKEVFGLEREGKLFPIYLYFCQRMELMGMMVDQKGNLFFEEEPMNENKVFLLIRKDFARDGFNVSEKGARHIVKRGLEKMIKDAQEIAIRENCIVKLAFKNNP